MRKKIILIIVILVLGSVYALEPGRLWINNVEIPSGCGDNRNRGIDFDIIKPNVCIVKGYGWGLESGDSTSDCWQEMCCGDDSGEYYIKGEDGTEACCDSRYDIVKNWECKERIFDASISIATLKDSYNVGEKIELTDPPDGNLVTGNVVGENINLRQDVIYEESGINIKKLKKDFDEGIIPETIDTSLLPKYVKGELIIKLKQDISNKITSSAVKTDISSIDELNRKYNVKKINNVFKVKEEKILEKIGNTAKELVGIKVHSRELKKIYKLEIPEEIDVEEVVKEYSKDSKVEYAEPNYISYISFVPNDARYNEQWAHQNTQAEQGWNIERGNSDVVIAIIDTGVDYNHEDLADNIWQNSDEIPDNGVDDDNNGYIDDIRGYDFVDINKDDYDLNKYEFLDGEDYAEIDNDPMDFNSHGTHCAGIAAAVTNNNIGIAGVCHNCKIMPVRAGFSIRIFYGLYGWIEGGSLENDDIANAIHYAADNNANVISMSFGGGGSNVEKEAIDYAYSKGVVLIAATGNSNTDSKSYPAAYDNIIAVSATSQSDERSYYSNYGYWTDVAAPGGDYYKDTMILSTVPPYTTYNSEFKVNGNIISSNVFEYSAISEQGINGELIFVNLGKTEELTMDLTGKIALIKRGDISFKEKVQNVYNKGAVGAIIYNNEDEDFRGTLQEQANIPAVSISKTDGENLVAQIDSGIITANLKVTSSIQKYDFYQGTSMATPYVAGLAGLILSKQGYSQEEVRQILRQSVDPVNSNKYIGTGRVNVLKALEFEPVNAVAEISSPENNEIISSNIDIIGTATGDSYSVYYGKGLYPENWIEISSGTNVNNDVLVNWNIENVDEGDFTIKLEVVKNNKKIKDFVRIIIARGYQEGWPQKYSEIETSIWNSPNLYDVNKDGYDEIIITGKDNSGKGKMNIFGYDGVQLDNWPQTVEDVMEAGLVVGDINNDGEIEIVASVTDNNVPKIYVWESNGNVLWSKILDPGHAPMCISLSDINNNGYLEIITTTHNSKLFVLDYTGNVLWFEFLNEIDSINPYKCATVADIDNNGYKEIIKSVKINKGESSLKIFDYNGNIKWEKYWIQYQVTPSSPILGDVNNDNKIEIIFRQHIYDGNRHYQEFYIFDPEGNQINSWSIDIRGNYNENIIISNLDDDEKLEIIYAGNNHLYVWKDDGSLLFNPIELISDSAVHPLSLPVVGDVNSDGKPDIILFTNNVYGDKKMFIIDNNGQIEERIVPFGNRVPNSPILDDTDKDGDIEVIYFSQDTLYVYDLDGIYNPSTMEWPMFQHDSQHTGNYHFGKIIRPQSKIVNNEDFDLTGNLYFIIERLKLGGIDIGSRTIWNEKITIPAKGLIKLDQIFNNLNYAIGVAGNYKIIVELRDKNNKIIKTKSGELKASWEFEVKEDITFTLSPKIQEGTAGSSLEYDLNIKNNDKTGKSRSFLITGRSPLVNGEKWIIDYYKIYNSKHYPDGDVRSNFIMDPQEEVIVKMGISSRSNWPNGEYLHYVDLNYGEQGEEIKLHNLITKTFVYRIIE